MCQDDGPSHQSFASRRGLQLTGLCRIQSRPNPPYRIVGVIFAASQHGPARSGPSSGPGPASWPSWEMGRVEFFRRSLIENFLHSRSVLVISECVREHFGRPLIESECEHPAVGRLYPKQPIARLSVPNLAYSSSRQAEMPQARRPTNPHPSAGCDHDRRSTARGACSIATSNCAMSGRLGSSSRSLA